MFDQENGAGCLVRAACLSDVTMMLPLIYAHAEYENRSASIGEASLRAALSGPCPMLFGWVAETHGQLVGYATAVQAFSTWNGRRFLDLDCVFVQSDFRGDGVGARLMWAVRDFALDLGIAEMQWQTPVWNVGARRFYQRLGASAQTKERFTWAIPRPEGGLG